MLAMQRENPAFIPMNMQSHDKFHQKVFVTKLGAWFVDVEPAMSTEPSGLIHNIHPLFCFSITQADQMPQERLKCMR